MAQIIDFVSRKKIIEDNKNVLATLKTEKTATNFSLISSKNKVSEEKKRKERDIANKNVMKNYKIK